MSRTIVITGASDGIGAAAAKTYAAHGATVLLLGKTEANLTQVYDEIEAAGHPQPAVIPFNLETALPHQYDELAAMIETESATTIVRRALTQPVSTAERSDLPSRSSSRIRSK